MQQSLLDKENYFKIFERFESANGSCKFYASLAQLAAQLICNQPVVGSSPTRSSIVCWNVAIRLGEPPIKSPTQKGVQDDSNH